MSALPLAIAPGSWPGVQEPVVLRPSGMLVLPGRGTGFVADLHLGKTAHFQRAGVAVPDGADAATLARLADDLRATPLQHLVVLGDLVHSRQALTPALQAQLLALRQHWPALQLHLVWGNHDRHAQQGLQALLATLGWHSCPPRGWREGPVHGLHDPQDALGDAQAEADTRLTLLGHVHPAVRLQAGARQRLRLPCFAAGPWGAGTRVLLPAYGHFTGQSPQLPKDCPWVYAIAQDQLLTVPPAGAPRGLR